VAETDAGNPHLDEGLEKPPKRGLNMRKSFVVILVLTMVAVACTPGGTVTEQESVPNNSPALDSVTLEALEQYPAPVGESSYPAPTMPAMPTGYPDITIVAPSGTVDLANLTPVAPDMTPQVMPSPGIPDATASIQASPLWQAVASDLSAYLDVPVESIQLVSAEAVSWPNGGLGCPVVGMAYTDMVVDGYLLLIMVDGNTYTYHTSGLNSFVHCLNGEPVSSGSATQN
jgi:hypothetical protein